MAKSKAKNARANQEMAHHEAAHAVAGVMMGAEFKTLSIVPRGNMLGYVDFRAFGRRIQRDVRGKQFLSDDDEAVARRRKERFIIILLAGPQGQKKFAPKSRWREEGMDDFVHALDMILELVDDNAEVASAYLRFLDLQAKELVKAHWAAIEHLARAALVHRRLSHHQVLQAIIDAQRWAA